MSKKHYEYAVNYLIEQYCETGNYDEVYNFCVDFFSEFENNFDREKFDLILFSKLRKVLNKEII